MTQSVIGDMYCYRYTLYFYLSLVWCLNIKLSFNYGIPFCFCLCYNNSRKLSSGRMAGLLTIWLRCRFGTNFSKKIMLLQHRPVEPWDLNQGIQITSTMFIDHYMFRWNIVRSFFQFATKFSKKKRSYASPSCGTTIPEPMNSVNIYYIYYGSLHVLLEQVVAAAQTRLRPLWPQSSDYYK